MKNEHCESGAFLILIVSIMRTEELKKLGQIIRTRREALGFTQFELAGRSHVDRNYIGMLERGERNPSYLSLLKIAEGLGVPLCKLFKK